MKLEIERLAYDGKVVLERINQKVEYGDFINLIGQNGSGKSSLFKALLGITRFKGKVDFPSSEIAVVSDYARVPNELQVGDVVDFVRKSNGKQIDELVPLLKLDRISNQKVRKLSSGEKRRVEIFVALASGKKIIIYDEITNALDAGIKQELLEFIKKYHSQNNRLAFFTTHDLAEVFYLGGKYWFINPCTKTIEDISGESQDSIMKKYMFGGK